MDLIPDKDCWRFPFLNAEIQLAWWAINAHDEVRVERVRYPPVPFVSRERLNWLMYDDFDAYLGWLDPF